MEVKPQSLSSSFSSISLSESTPPPSTPPSFSATRLWRPAAQRNLRNQWSTLVSLKQKWTSSSSTARSQATSLVNAYLSQRYMSAMDLGVLSDMPNIREKACQKLLKQQEVHRSKLLSSYKDMVAIVGNMVNSSRSLRCFCMATSNGSITQFSSIWENSNDNGDGGGIPVFTFWSVSSFEKLARELVQMFVLELNLKRLLVIEFLSLSNEEIPQNSDMCWSEELYPGEFSDLSKCNLDSKGALEPVPPRLEGWKSDNPMQPNCKLDTDILQVYLTTWLAEVHIDKDRVDEIISEVGEEMNVAFS